MPFVKIVVYTPLSHADKIRQVLAQSGAGHIGNYDFCSFSVKGIGRFRPIKGAKPFVGQEGKIEEVEEERIETICEQKEVQQIIKEVKKIHPYEEPAIDVYPVI
jgi:hypothetical protein